jgi:hypothetical protein
VPTRLGGRTACGGRRLWGAGHFIHGNIKGTSMSDFSEKDVSASNVNNRPRRGNPT